MGRKEADGEGGCSHQEQADDQHFLAADTVPKVTKDDAAYRPRHEADGISAKCQENTSGGLFAGKEERSENQRCGGSLEKEVVQLDRRTDQTGKNNLTNGVVRTTAGNVAGCLEI